MGHGLYMAYRALRVIHTRSLWTIALSQFCPHITFLRKGVCSIGFNLLLNLPLLFLLPGLGGKGRRLLNFFQNPRISWARLCWAVLYCCAVFAHRRCSANMLAARTWNWTSFTTWSAAIVPRKKIVVVAFTKDFTLVALSGRLGTSFFPHRSLPHNMTCAPLCNASCLLNHVEHETS